MALAIYAYNPSEFESDAIPAKYYWCATAQVDGKQARKYFRRKVDAVTWAEWHSCLNYRIEHWVYVHGLGRWRTVSLITND
jgi:hypothetical protein